MENIGTLNFGRVMILSHSYMSWTSRRAVGSFADVIGLQGVHRLDIPCMAPQCPSSGWNSKEVGI